MDPIEKNRMQTVYTINHEEEESIKESIKKVPQRMTVKADKNENRYSTFKTVGSESK